MAIYKNKASQKFAVYAYDSTDESAKTGDAANISAQISLDGAATSATNDVTPTELDAADAPGVYLFDMTQAETNADLVIVAAVSSTGNIVLKPIFAYPQPEIREANIVQISGDSTAADNLEAMLDGTGYTDDAAPATQAQVGAIGSGSAGAINFEATEDNASGAIIDSVVKVGTPTGTFVNTETEDGTVLSIADVANDIDWVIGFDIGGNRQATEASIVANVNGNADEMKVKAYDHVGAGWNIIGTLSGSGGSTAQALNLALLSKHTGTGSELGKVYIRFDTDSTTPALLEIDKCLIAAVSTSQSTGYVNGQIWIDTVDGTAGTEAHVNGVANNPVDTLADVITLSGSTKANLDGIHVSSSSTITLAANLQNYNVFGIGYTLDFAGFDCSGTHFYHASPVTGIVLSGGSDHVDILDSIIGNMTCNNAHFTNCSLTNATITLGSVASTVRFVNCRSVLAGSGTPVIDFGTGSANHDLTMSNYQNGIEIRNFNVVTTGGTDTMSLSGCGQLIIASTCDGGTINLRGQWKVTDNSGGAVTIAYDDVAANVISILADTAVIGAAGAGLTDLGGMSTGMKAEVNTEADTALTDYDAPTKAEMDTAHGLLATEAKQDIIDTNVDTLITRIPAALFSGITSLAEWLGLLAGKQAANSTALTEIKASGAGSGTYSETTDSLEAVRDNQGGGSLTGVNTVTITVDDGTNPLENAKVRVTSGADTDIKSTNVSGVTTFSLDNATWTIAITLHGYTFASTTLVVGSNTSETYSMTQISVTSSLPGFCTAFATCRDELGVVKLGASVSVRIKEANGLTGSVFESAVTTEVSGADGLVQFTGLIQQAKYEIRRGLGKWTEITMPSGTTFEIPNFIGID